jgi:hypothetical protein
MFNVLSLLNNFLLRNNFKIEIVFCDFGNQKKVSFYEALI